MLSTGRRLKPTDSRNLVSNGKIKIAAPISHHTSVVYEGKMYLFGGSHTLDCNKIFYALNLEKMTWEIVRQRAADNDQSNIPEAADEHTAVV